MRDYRSHTALFIANLMYGANYVIAKGLMPNLLGPNGFIFFRVIGASILFWIIYALRFERVARADIGRIAICALFGVACNQLCFFNGLMLTSPVNASVIMTLTPILVLILSVIFLSEKVRRLQLVGVVVGAIGSVIFSLSNEGSAFSTGIGDLFIFINAASYSIYLALVKPLMAKYRPLTVIAWVFAFGLVYVSLFPLTLTEVGAVDWSKFDGESISRFVFVIVGVTFVPYLLNIYSMKRLSPYITAVYIYLQPLLATGFIFLFMMLGLEDYSKDITLVKVASAALIFTGVYLVIRPQKQVSTS